MLCQFGTSDETRLGLLARHSVIQKGKKKEKRKKNWKSGNPRQFGEALILATDAIVPSPKDTALILPQTLSECCDTMNFETTVFILKAAEHASFSSPVWRSETGRSPK